MAEQRSHTAGRFSLEIDGYNAGFLKKFSGMAMEADIVSNDLGPDNVQKKHVSNIKWTPGKATVGIGMLTNQAVYREMAEQFLASFPFIYITGVLALVSGLAILNAHNAWTRDWRSTITASSPMSRSPPT